MGIFRKTEGIQSYLRIWGTYDPTELDPSDPKKRWLNGCRVKKCRFWRQKWASAAATRPAVQQGQHKNVVFWYPAMMVTKNLGDFQKKHGFLATKTGFFCQKICIFYAILSSYGPNSMGSSLPHIMRYFGCLRFSGRRPFGWLAGRFMAQLPKMTLFGSKKCCLLRPKCCDLGNKKTCSGKNTPLNFCIRLTHEEPLHYVGFKCTFETHN